MRQEHRAGEKLFVDFPGLTIPIYDERDLTVSYAKLAKVHRQSGDKPKARGFLRQGQEIMARLTKLTPDNAVWKKDLARFDGQIKELGP